MNDIIEKTMKNLRKNNMAAYYVEKKEQVVPLIKEIVPQGSSVSNGGSESLVECGVFDLLESGYYDFIDRRKYDAETVRECYIKAFGCDAFFCSSNAVTENGELYNVDGNSNRVACIVYGPEKVIMVVGKNKIVPDIEAAVKRVKKISAPLNTKRLHCKTPCESTGECLSLAKDGAGICAGCQSPQRICCNYVVSARQRHKNRINVIIVGEELGY